MHLFRAISLAASIAALAACSSASGSPTAPEDDAGNMQASDAAVPADAGADAACHGLVIDDAGVTHGCGSGGMGIGDRDDGGGMAAPPPDASMTATNLPYAASCWNNAQCASGICFDYKVKGTFCTQTCMTSADCPLIDDAGTMSAGCNGMGVCRVP